MEQGDAEVDGIDINTGEVEPVTRCLALAIS